LVYPPHTIITDILWGESSSIRIGDEYENNDIEIKEEEKSHQKIFQMMENFIKKLIKLKEINNLQKSNEHNDKLNKGELIKVF
jgi:hypothetical protein